MANDKKETKDGISSDNKAVGLGNVEREENILEI